MQLYRKVKAVEKIYRVLGRETERFQKASGLHCIEGCSVCCTKPGIEASPLEFLPLAYHLFAARRAWEILTMLSETDMPDTCIFYDRVGNPSTPGRCLEYPHRGLICRLFGSSGIADRVGRTRYAACRAIKEGDPLRFQAVDRAASEGTPIPRGQCYYMMLNAVDASLMTYHPINTAIRKSIETVLSYYSYRRRRAG